MRQWQLNRWCRVLVKRGRYRLIPTHAVVFANQWILYYTEPGDRYEHGVILKTVKECREFLREELDNNRW